MTHCCKRSIPYWWHQSCAESRQTLWLVQQNLFNSLCKSILAERAFVRSRLSWVFFTSALILLKLLRQNQLSAVATAKSWNRLAPPWDTCVWWKSNNFTRCGDSFFRSSVSCNTDHSSAWSRWSDPQSMQISTEFVFNVALIYALWSGGKIIIWLICSCGLPSWVLNFLAQNTDVSLGRVWKPPDVRQLFSQAQNQK